MQIRERRVTRRHFLMGGAVVAAGVAFDALSVEPRRLTVTQHQLGSGTERIRLVQLSDLHLAGDPRFEERIAAHVSELKPDVILITGDAVDRARGILLLQYFLDMLPRSTPRIATLGNWEYWSKEPLDVLSRVYDNANGRLLVNATSTLTVRGKRIAFVGLDDFVAGKPDVRIALSPTADYTNTILIQHCPGYRDQMPLKDLPRFHCMLSGHTHGGQIALPGWAPYTPGGSGHYVKGWYRDEGRVPIYVSRGIGTTVIPARLFSPPEIAVFDLAV